MTLRRLSLLTIFNSISVFFSSLCFFAVSPNKAARTTLGGSKEKKWARKVSSGKFETKFSSRIASRCYVTCIAFSFSPNSQFFSSSLARVVLLYGNLNFSTSQQKPGTDDEDWRHVYATSVKKIVNEENFYWRTRVDLVFFTIFTKVQQRQLARGGCGSGTIVLSSNFHINLEDVLKCFLFCWTRAILIWWNIEFFHVSRAPAVAKFKTNAAFGNLLIFIDFPCTACWSLSICCFDGFQPLWTNKFSTNMNSLQGALCFLKNIKSDEFWLFLKFSLHSVVPYFFFAFSTPLDFMAHPPPSPGLDLWLAL